MLPFLRNCLKVTGAIVRPLLSSAVLFHGTSFGQAPIKERIAVLEVGAASNWDQNAADWKGGPHIALEFTPLEDKQSRRA